MDPVTAFGLAGTAATFVDFGLKLVKLTWTIYHAEDEEATLAGELAQTAKSFEEAANSIKTSGPQATEHRLGQLVNESVDFSNKLVQRLQKEGLLGTQSRSAKKALGTALRHIYRSKELSELKDKIVELERQLSLQILISLRQFATQTLKNQETILSTLHVSSDNDQNTTTGTQAILQHVTAQNHQASREPLQRGLEFNIIEQLYQNSNIETASKIVLTADELIRMNQTILSALSYTGMGDRRDRVARTFETTFAWILEDDKSADEKSHSLSKWFAGPESIYWISGKPGSGKSTLMKYLSSSMGMGEPKTPRCQPFLKRWAGERTLIVAPFYFWAADAGQMQKSRAGLLRTLLYHILSARSDLIPVVLPSRWETLAIVGVHQQLGEWTVSELQDCLFHALKALETSSSCICFFIDGLDEFGDDPQILIDFVRVLTSLGVHIKLCVASRPWIEFQDAFEPERHLLLEDLTRKDINLFVSRKFNQNPEFAELHIREPVYAKNLIENVVSKSAGVFLWVALVVSSLLAGITNADRVEDLQRRLELLPPDLESLYERILTGLDEFYHQHRAHMIMLMESAEHALPLLVFALADESNSSSILEFPQEPMQSIVLNVRMKAARRRLITRWKGLIEVGHGEDITISSEGVSSFEPAVEYLHRSVKDFVQSPVMQGYLSTYVSPSYDPHFQLCLAYCGCIKAGLCTESLQVPTYAVSALLHASKVSASKQGDLLTTINNLAHAAHSNSLLQEGDYHIISVLTQTGVVAFISDINARRFGTYLVYTQSPSITYASLMRPGNSATTQQCLKEALKLGFLVFPMQEADVRDLRSKLEDFRSKPEDFRSKLEDFRTRLGDEAYDLDPLTKFVIAEAKLKDVKRPGGLFARMKNAVRRKL